MSDTAALGTLTVEMLRATFPEWRVFEHVGAWWATRGGIQVWDGPRSLIMRSLTAPDLTTLADRLCAQEWLDGLDDDALAAIYRGDSVDSALWPGGRLPSREPTSYRKITLTGGCGRYLAATGLA
jgi:hypothetical protein